AAGVGDESRRGGFVRESESAQVGQAQDLGHFRVIDFVRGVGGVVVVGVKAGEPPKRRKVVQHERELIASEEDIQGVVAVETVVQIEADVLVFFLHDAIVVGAVRSADEVQPVGGISGNFDQDRKSTRLNSSH